MYIYICIYVHTNSSANGYVAPSGHIAYKPADFKTHKPISIKMNKPNGGAAEAAVPPCGGAIWD